MKHAEAPLAWIIHISTLPERDREKAREREELTLQQWIVGTDVWFLRRTGLCFGWASNFNSIWYFSFKVRGDLELGRGKWIRGDQKREPWLWGGRGERGGGPPCHPSQWHFNDCQISSPVQTHLLSLCMNESIWGSHHPAHGRAPSHIHDGKTIWKWVTW